MDDDPKDFWQQQSGLHLRTVSDGSEAKWHLFRKKEDPLAIIICDSEWEATIYMMGYAEGREHERLIADAEIAALKKPIEDALEAIRKSAS